MLKPIDFFSPATFRDCRFINLIKHNPFLRHNRGVVVINQVNLADLLGNDYLIPTPPFRIIKYESLLNHFVWLYALKKKFYVELKYWYDYGRLKPRHYVACASACNLGYNFQSIAVDYSGKHIGATGFHPDLMALFKKELNAVPYNKSPETETTVKHKVGNCAEQNAANDIMTHTNCQPEDLNFSFALRPRTMTIMDPCDNCKKIFPNAPRI